MIHKPTLLVYENYRFLVMGSPDNDSVQSYLEEFEKANVVALVRSCEKTYDDKPFEEMGIEINELNFPDGAPPPKEIIQQWLKIVKKTFKKKKEGGMESSASPKTIAVHCLAGLGRAPVLVAIALIEHGLGNLEAINFIRNQRRGAMNNRQANFIMQYKKMGGEGKCLIM